MIARLNQTAATTERLDVHEILPLKTIKSIKVKVALNETDTVAQGLLHYLVQDPQYVAYVHKYKFNDTLISVSFLLVLRFSFAYN